MFVFYLYNIYTFNHLSISIFNMIVQIWDYYYYNTILKKRKRVALRDNSQVWMCNTQWCFFLISYIYIYLYINEWKSKPEHLYVIIIDIQILPCYNDAVVVKNEIIGISISNICFIWISRSLNRHMILKYRAMS